ncbi:MAG TPA: NUDIX domain-containing protein [Candidatus Saccharimonadales bacterium]|nr:NUDIX domain-containing protein [Candidatus Saccharimonadales bacterium]
MHKLQEHILSVLIMHPTVRYSELKPKDVESNLFMYHLKQLSDQGLVAKVTGGYSLTAAGKVYADRLSLKTFQPRLQPRIVTLIMLKNDQGQYLLYRRLRQPLINMVGFPYGKVHVGEAVLEAATRELKEKTGLAAELSHRGDGYITMSQNGENVSQVLFHAFLGANASGTLIKKSKVGEAFWADPKEVPGWELMPSVLDLIEAAGSTGRFFCELNYQLESA